MQIWFHINRVVVRQVIEEDSNKGDFQMKEDLSKINRTFEENFLTNQDSEIEELCVVKEAV